MQLPLCFISTKLEVDFIAFLFQEGEGAAGVDSEASG